MDMLLDRAESTSQATTGLLTAGSRAFFTIEPPAGSCVPSGIYDLIPYDSPTHGPTWALRNPALAIMGIDTLTSAQIAAGFHNFCELHNGNYARQSDRCVLVGLRGQPMLDDKTGFVVPAVQHSVDAFTDLRTILGPGSIGHTLMIK